MPNSLCQSFLFLFYNPWPPIRGIASLKGNTLPMKNVINGLDHPRIFICKWICIVPPILKWRWTTVPQCSSWLPDTSYWTCCTTSSKLEWRSTLQTIKVCFEFLISFAVYLKKFGDGFECSCLIQLSYVFRINRKNSVALGCFCDAIEVTKKLLQKGAKLDAPDTKVG